LEPSTSGVDKIKDSETSKQLREVVITECDSKITDQKQHELHTTQQSTITRALVKSRSVDVASELGMGLALGLMLGEV